MNGPVASIIVALIVTIGSLFGFGAFTPDLHTYATVKFDGGYKKIGVITSEEIYSEVKITLKGESIRSGSVEDVAAWIEQRARDGQQPADKTTYKVGVTVEGNAGIKWSATESSFKLSTDSLELVSTESAPLYPLEVAASLRRMLEKAKSERVRNSANALVFSKAPSESDLLKILRALGK